MIIKNSLADKKEIVCLAGPLIQSEEESNAWRKKFLEEWVKAGYKIVSPVDFFKKVPEQK